jgi:hypothetical protein
MPNWIKYDISTKPKDAIVKHAPHGPFSPCPKSPTGDHCWHNIGNGVKQCCHCGTTRDFWR